MACVATVVAKLDKEDLEKFNEIERTIKGLGKEINATGEWGLDIKIILEPKQ